MVERLALSFFPYPYLHEGKRYPGLRYDWPSRCSNCDRQCEMSSAAGVQLCSYGVNFFKLDDDTLVAGLVIRDFPGHSQARRKMLRKHADGPTVAEVEDVRQASAAVSSAEASDVRARKDAVIAGYRTSEAYKEELIMLLKPEMKRMLAQIHDYKQFVSQVARNVNVILERRSPGVDMEQKLASASHEEQAIYWAARLMEEKIQTALFLLDPDRINDPDSIKAFRFHGCVMKYLKIYQRGFDQKELQVTVKGESYGMVVANPAAASVIPHTLIDNALKYAPRGSRVDLSFAETGDDIEFSVTSLGPRVDPDEIDRIFDLFYRGRLARKIEPDGTGFGLYLSQLIALKLGTKITVAQDTTAHPGNLHRTEFSVRLPRS